MLLVETWIFYSKPHGKEVDGNLPLRVSNDGLPPLLVTVRTIDNKETAVRGVEDSSVVQMLRSNIVMTFQTPHQLSETTMRCPLGTREKYLGIEPVDEGRMQIELCLGVQEVLKAVHDAKIQNKV